MPEDKTLCFPRFDSLYIYFYKRAFYFTKSYVFDDLVAEDIVSESLIKLWEQIRKNHVDSPEAFLITVLKHKALDYLKHEQIKEEAFKEMRRNFHEELSIRISILEACNPDEVYSSEIQRIVNDTLSGLSKESRLIFEMSRSGEKTNREIASELGVSIKNVEYHIAKALKILRVRLKDYLPAILFLLCSIAGLV